MINLKHYKHMMTKIICSYFVEVKRYKYMLANLYYLETYHVQRKKTHHLITTTKRKSRNLYKLVQKVTINNFTIKKL